MGEEPSASPAPGAGGMAGFIWREGLTGILTGSTVTGLLLLEAEAPRTSHGPSEPQPHKGPRTQWWHGITP